MTLHNRANNLPRQTTTFIGRERDVKAIVTLLSEPHVGLVTLTGPGGVGKTRLSLQVGAELLDAFADGVWIVQLAPISDSRLVVAAILRALHVEEGAGLSLEDSLELHLKEKQMLLLLDNFEHVSQSAQQVSQLLAACPNLKILVTSRAALQIKGEKEYPVSPMKMPDLRHLPPLEKLRQYEAVRLFVERARDVKADFQLTDQVASDVAEICVRLDGLPLAIELTVAHLKIFSPAVLLARLSDMLTLLTGGPKDLTARESTMKGSIDWSYELLTDGEQQLFRRMVPFSGGGSLEAVEAVCNYDGQLQLEVWEGVESLLNKSLIQQREGSDGEPRFWMLEPLHEYAKQKMTEGEVPQALNSEHALYFTKLAEKAEPFLTGANQAEWLGKLEDEHDNMRAALRWAKERQDVETALRLAGALWRFWSVRGYLSQGREQLQSAISLASMSAETPGESNSIRASQPRSLEALVAKCLTRAGSVAFAQADYTAAHSLHEQSLAISRKLGDKALMDLAFHGLGNVASGEGDYAAAGAFFEQSLAISEELGDKWGIAISLNSLGNVAYELKDFTTARSLYEQSLAMRRALKDDRGIANSLNSLGNLASVQEEYDAARALYEESLVLRKKLGDKRGLALAWANLGNVAYNQKDYDAARSFYTQGLVIQRELGNKWGIADTLAGLGAVWIETAGTGEPTGRGEIVRLEHVQRGTRLLAAARALLEAIGAVWELDGGLVYERAVASARARLGDEGFESASEQGRTMSMEQAIEYALQDRPSPGATEYEQPIAQESRSLVPGEYPGGLTAREVEVLRWVAQGLTNAAVGKQLSVAVTTINAHMRSIYTKLGVNSRAAAVRFAVENHLI